MTCPDPPREAERLPTHSMWESAFCKDLDDVRSLGAWEGQMFNIWKRGCLNKAIRRLLCSAVKEMDWLFQHQRAADTMGTRQATASGGGGDPCPRQGRPQSALKPPNKICFQSLNTRPKTSRRGRLSFPKATFQKEHLPPKQRPTWGSPFTVCSGRYRVWTVPFFRGTD